jgi:hypothetical protein
MNGLGRELALLPTAVATDTFRKANGALRIPPDGHPVLQFAAGARIIGIEFPEKYNGEWGIGWADNTRAAFPIDAVRLLAPPTNMIPSPQSPSLMRAIARWKRSPKDKEPGPWLKFDKGEVITGINCEFQHTVACKYSLTDFANSLVTFQEHWCWSGYNSKNKWGIFPQSHMEPGTLSEAIPDRLNKPGSDGGSINESKSGGVLAKFSSIRRRDNRPVTSDSHSSNETAMPHSPRPSIY